MTGPTDPGDDWGFPEVDPASTALPDAGPASEPEVFDTGSDAWWRAQAQAQRAAAASDPVVPPAPPADPEPVAPPELVEPSVLNQPVEEPSPLDETWLPPDLPELRPPAEPEPAADLPPREVRYARPPGAEEPEPAEPAAPVEPAAEAPYEQDLTDPHGIPAVEEPIWSGPSYDDPPRERTVAEPERVGVARALAGAALAVGGVVLGICALLLFGDDEPKGTPTVSLPPTATTAPTSQPTTPAPTAAPTTEPTTEPTAQPTPTVQAAPVVPVSVLNNSRIKDLAKKAAARFEAGGWPVPVTGNYRGGTIARTTVYYAPGQQASAERFARQFGIPRVAPRFPGLPTQAMTVVLTRDYA